ncbi:hypothetical protein JOQ06_000071 [Pogonophryne albipinna]|uniref:FAM21/CAPZIP domain-containing protein n=1 Tax=Pogonophryne albipinna TaxID=1090488 RepID=A0AAD6A5N4_9TELE|nr:hypothetical protein JOQ06_000071 [Pogonophryne albipinna]
MEEEAAPRRSVSELAGRFKNSTAALDAAATETEKPVRRRPPRSLDIKPSGDQQPPGVTSPLPAKAKRNSALIEKLQMNLSLAPSTMIPSPKSPGFRMLSPFSPPPSPGPTPPSPGHAPPAPVATVTPTSPIASSPLAEEEGPASFEAPPTAGDGAILSNSNIKSRARHSIRRRPPSRRHRTSSSEEGVTTEGEEKTPVGGEKEEGDVFRKDGETDAATSPEKHETNEEEEEESKVSVESREEEKKKKEEEEGYSSSSGRTGEEDKQEAATNTESTEEEEKETSSSSR